MAVRSTTSAFQPVPPNYAVPTGPYSNIGRYREYSAAVGSPHGPNMSTAPTTTSQIQYRYIPRVKG